MSNSKHTVCYTLSDEAINIVTELSQALALPKSRTAEMLIRMGDTALNQLVEWTDGGEDNENK